MYLSLYPLTILVNKKRKKRKATWLCARTQQHHVRSVAALSGEHAELAPLKRASVGHKLATTQHTQHTTTTGLSTGSKFANSPIIIAKLNVKLTEYALVNEPHANELMKGFFNGFRLGYMGSRVLKKSKNLISVKENMDEVYRKINGEI